MARPRQFDTTVALRAAARAFWRHGYAGTSTEALLAEMQIGRQSLYNSFGDKRQVFLDALRLYTKESVAAHVVRLESAADPLDGLRAMLRGLAVEDDDDRARGCFGVLSATEFGTTDSAVTQIGVESQVLLHERIRHRLHEAVSTGGLAPGCDVEAAAVFVEQQMTALQVAARSGASAAAMRAAADFAIDRL